MADPRFDTSRDPRFKRAPRSVRRVEVDKRFSHMFTDEQFIETSKVDKRGLKQRSNCGRTKLEQFYSIAPLQTEAAPAPVVVGKRKAKRKKALTKPKTDEGIASDENREEDEAASNDDDEEAVATSEGEESDEESGMEDDDDDDVAVDTSVWETDEATAPTGDATSRLVLMGCDWDRVSAVDLLVMLRTYLRCKESRKVSAVGKGSVNKVLIYPSDYGLERLAEEATNGPLGLGEATKVTNGAEDEEDIGEQTPKQMEALRRYQKQRTKYYYAVAECDSATTAAWLYDQMDGLEADGICLGLLDMRFAPDDIEFPHEPKEVATDTPKAYAVPLARGKSATGHTKVECSWDEVPIKRRRDLMKKRFTPNELMDADLNEYLASSDSDEESTNAGSEKGGRRKSAKALRQLVEGISDSDGSGGEVMGDMEATFSVSAARAEERVAEKVERARTQPGGAKVHTLGAAAPAQEKSPWETFLEKKKAKKKERRAAAKAERDGRRKSTKEEENEGGEPAQENDLELLAMDALGEGDDRGFNMRGKKRGVGGKANVGAKVGAEDSFQVDLNDPRIAQVFSSSDFQIDPTHPEFKATSGMKAVLKKKRARKLSVGAAADDVGAEAQARSVPRSTANAVDASGAPAPLGHRPAVAAAAVGGFQLFAGIRKAAVAEGGAAAPAADAAAQDEPSRRKRPKRVGL